MSKITIATVKAFIRKNREKLLVRVSSEFDGMVDGCVTIHGAKFAPAVASNIKGCDSATMGIEGVWFVGGSRNSCNPLTVEGLIGFEVYNCCGKWAVAIQA